MLLYFSVLGTGVVTLLWSSALFLFRKKIDTKKALPGNKPLWLILLCWFYLVLTICAWAGFAEKINAISLLGVVIVTLSTVKMILLLFSYSQMQNIFLMIWQDARVFGVIMGSTFTIGLLMVFVSTWIS